MPSIPAPARLPQLTFEEIAPGRARMFSVEDALGEQLEDLERWVSATVREQRREVWRFWTLRVPTLLVAVLALLCVPMGFAVALPGLAAAVAVLLGVDAVWPGGTEQAPLRRAVFELRRLQNTVKLRWDRVRLAHPDPVSSKRIAYAIALLDAIQSRREGISRYLRGLVPSPGVGRRPFDQSSR